MHLKLREFGLLLSAAVTLFALAACGSPQTTSPSPTPNVAASPIPTATAPPAPTAAATATALPPSPSPTLEPTAKATPSPTFTPVPSALAEETFAFLEQFTLEYSPRESATDAELAAAQFLKSRFEELGYEAHLQEFTVGPLLMSELVVTAQKEEIWSRPMSQSWEGDASGVFRFVGKAFEEDIPAEGLEGAVALIERGEVTFEEKVNRVAEAGAVGAVVFNNRPGRYYGDLRNPSSIPAISISRGDGQDLLELIEEGDVEAQVTVKSETLPSRNVIAEMPSSNDAGRAVVVGAHYDTVPDSPGANDNASGIATVMTMAKRVAGTSYPFAIRFVLFGAEEVGLFGSRHYVEALGPEGIVDIVAMLNFDSVGSGSGFGVIGDGGLAQEALRLGERFGPKLVRPTTLPPNVGSDHLPFEAEEIPIMFLMSDDSTRIHTPEDKLEWVESNLLGWSAEIGIGLLDWLSSEEAP